jgi:hypothetical protein
MRTLDDVEHARQRIIRPRKGAKWPFIPVPTRDHRHEIVKDVAASAGAPTAGDGSDEDR